MDYIDISYYAPKREWLVELNPREQKLVRDAGVPFRSDGLLYSSKDRELAVAIRLAVNGLPNTADELRRLTSSVSYRDRTHRFH